ncbi:MAG: insulinase family protein [Krumholzibacteria bacterium]|nr:insulinase family protein [Candidatus Krumholzibacteria bacterium]
MPRIPAAALLLVALAGTALPAGARPDAAAGYDDLPLEPAFPALPANLELLRLENGLEVVLLRNPAQPMVGIYTQVKVGSARENARTSGMSHMLEHLLFNGTAKWYQEALYAETDRLGAYNNANTSDFYTNFMTVLPAANLAGGLELQSQMLFHSLIPADKFAKEQGIVLGELVQARDRPGHALDETLRSVLFAGSGLELPTLGTRASIAHLQRDDVHAFWRTWYVPNNMVLTLAGNFERDRAVALLQEHYGAVAPATLPDAEPLPLPPIEQTRALTRRVGDRRTVALAFEAPTWGMGDFHPFQVLTELLTLDGSGLLTRVLDGLDAAVRPEVSLWWERAPGHGRLVFRFTLPEGLDPGQCYRLVQDAVAAGLDLGIGDEDLLGVVRMAETATLLEREQLRMTGIYTAETLVLGGVDAFAGYLDGLRAVTGADVLRALETWLADAPCQAVLVEPEAGAAAAAPAGWAPLPVERSELANGAVLVSQTNEASPVLAIHLAVRGRALLDSEAAAAGALDLVHRLLDEGYAGCDAGCLAGRLRALGAVVKKVDDPRIPMDDYYTNGRFSWIRIETAARHGAEVLDLLVREIQHAAFDAGDFARLRDERVAELQRRQASARATADRLLDRTLFAGHPLALEPEGTVESLSGLTFDQVRALYRRAFSPENLVFAVVGPLAHRDLARILEQNLAGRGRPAAGLPPLVPTAGPAEVSAKVGGQLTAIRLGSVLAIDPADAPALEMAVAVLGDRLAMDLRETRGLSYSTGASLEIHGGQGVFIAWLNPPAERLAEGRQALRGAVAGFDPATVTQQELDRLRSARNGRQMMRRLSSMGQAYHLAMAEMDGDLAGYLEQAQRLEAVALADLRRAAATYLGAAPLVEVVVD